MYNSLKDNWIETDSENAKDLLEIALNWDLHSVDIWDAKKSRESIGDVRRVVLADAQVLFEYPRPRCLHDDESCRSKESSLGTWRRLFRRKEDRPDVGINS